VGIGSKRGYADTNTKYGFADSCSKLDSKQIALGTKYTITTSLTPGRYAIETKGGSIDGGFAYHTKSVGESLASENTLYLFASNHNGQPANTAIARIYGVKIWQTDSVAGTEVLVRDLKPCRKNGRAGLYDEVSQTILYSGAPDDLDPSYRPVSYIESTGAQYINTGIIPKTGTKTEVTVKFNASPKSVVVVMGTGKQTTESGSSRFWMPAIYDWYLYAGCGRVQRYIEYQEPNGGVVTGYSKLDKQLSSSQTYTLTTDMTPDGFYNTTGSGGNFTGGYVYRDVSAQGFLSSSDPMYLFGANEQGSLVSAASLRFFGAKIWQTNGVDGTYVLLRDFKPIALKNGLGGIVDLCSGTLYPSATSTPFIPYRQVWSNAAGDNSFDNPANWSEGRLPERGESVSLKLTDASAVTVSGTYVLSALVVTGSGTLVFTGDGSVSYRGLEIAAGAAVCRRDVNGLFNGELRGSGRFILDPGEGKTLTMTTGNVGFTGEAVIQSGTVKFGNSTSFGPVNRASFIRVKSGATLDTGAVGDGTYGTKKEKNKVILEEGATFLCSGPMTDEKYMPVSRLTLEGDATVDTSRNMVAIGLHYHDWYSHIDLGTNTLTVTGGKTFHISVCEITGTGTLDVQSGTTVASTCEYDTTATVSTCSEGTIRLRDGARWHLWCYNVNGGRNGRLSVKNLILDGQVTREKVDSTLTVTGSVCGKGTTPMLTLAEGAVFKPSPEGFLTVTETLTLPGGRLLVDVSDVPETVGRLPLLKVSSADMLPADVDFVGGTRWHAVRTPDGLGYELRRMGFMLTIR
jgi:hypothetical protein